MTHVQLPHLLCRARRNKCTLHCRILKCHCVIFFFFYSFPMVLKSSLYLQECFKLTISQTISVPVLSTQNSGFTGETVQQSQKQKISGVTYVCVQGNIFLAATAFPVCCHCMSATSFVSSRGQKSTRSSPSANLMYLGFARTAQQRWTQTKILHPKEI